MSVCKTDDMKQVDPKFINPLNPVVSLYEGIRENL